MGSRFGVAQPASASACPTRTSRLTGTVDNAAFRMWTSLRASNLGSPRHPRVARGVLGDWAAHQTAARDKSRACCWLKRITDLERRGRETKPPIQFAISRTPNLRLFHSPTSLWARFYVPISFDK